MGGNVFDGVTRRVTPADREKIKNMFEEITSLDYSRFFSFFGSSFHEKEFYGDLDIVVDEKTSNWFIEKGYHWKVIGENIHFLVDGIQVDLKIAEPGLAYNWILPATVTSKFDIHKTAIRNELLFAVVKYIPTYKGEVLTYCSEGRVENFTRFRFTLFDGIVKSEYTYKGEKVYLKVPVKVADKKKFTDFGAFYNNINERRDIRYLSFVEVLTDIENSQSIKSEHKQRIYREAIAGIEKKGLEVPREFNLVLIS